MTKQYGIYHTRWQVSAIAMMPFMIGLEMLGLPLWLNLMIGQFIGALIFWEIDKRIFGQHRKDTLENEMNKKYKR
jgi:hypothetical protein